MVSNTITDEKLKQAILKIKGERIKRGYTSLMICAEMFNIKRHILNHLEMGMFCSKLISKERYDILYKIYGDGLDACIGGVQ